MYDSSALALLGSEEKWRGMPISHQLTYSMATHLLVLGLLFFLFSQTASRNTEANSISFELINSSSPDNQVVASAVPSVAVNLNQKPDNISNPVERPMESLPLSLSFPRDISAWRFTAQKQCPQTEFDFLPSLAQHTLTVLPPSSQLRALIPSNSQFPRTIKFVSVSGAHVSSANLQPVPSDHAVNTKAAVNSELSPIKIAATDLNLANSNLPPVISSVPSHGALALIQKSFAELDGQACHSFVEGENSQKSGDAAKAKEHWIKAIAIMEMAIPILRRETGVEDSTQMAEALRNVGRCYDELKEFDKSEKYYFDSAQMCARVSGAACVGRGVSLVFLADSLINQKRFKDAEEPLMQSLPIYRQTYGDKSKYVAWTYQRLSRICLNTERKVEGNGWQEKADSILAN